MVGIYAVDLHSTDGYVALISVALQCHMILIQMERPEKAYGYLLSVTIPRGSNCALGAVVFDSPYCLPIDCYCYKWVHVEINGQWAL